MSARGRLLSLPFGVPILRSCRTTGRLWPRPQDHLWHTWLEKDLVTESQGALGGGEEPMERLRHLGREALKRREWG